MTRINAVFCQTLQTHVAEIVTKLHVKIDIRNERMHGEKEVKCFCANPVAQRGVLVQPGMCRCARRVHPDHSRPQKDRTTVSASCMKTVMLTLLPGCGPSQLHAFLLSQCITPLKAEPAGVRLLAKSHQNTLETATECDVKR